MILPKKFTTHTCALRPPSPVSLIYDQSDRTRSLKSAGVGCLCEEGGQKEDSEAESSNINQTFDLFVIIQGAYRVMQTTG